MRDRKGGEKERGQQMSPDMLVMWNSSKPVGYQDGPPPRVAPHFYPVIANETRRDRIYFNFRRHDGIKILFHCHFKGNFKRHGFVSLCSVQAQPVCGPSLQRRGGNMTSSSTASPPSSATSRVRCWHNKQTEYLLMRITDMS